MKRALFLNCASVLISSFKASHENKADLRGRKRALMSLLKDSRKHFLQNVFINRVLKEKVVLREWGCWVTINMCLSFSWKSGNFTLQHPILCRNRCYIKL